MKIGDRPDEVADALDVLNLPVEASCPQDLLRSSSVAIDGTDLPTLGRLYGDEDTVDLDMEEEADELVDDVTARRAPKPARGKPRARALAIGEDGRKVYTADASARAGWRTATNSRPAGPYVGRECHLMVQARDIAWSNGAAKMTPGPSVPALIRGFSLVSAGTHRGRTATNVVLSALHRGPNQGRHRRPRLQPREG